MATESRTGFRLPWSLENRGAAGTVDEQVAPEPVDDASAEPTATPVLHALDGGMSAVDAESATVVATDEPEAEAAPEAASGDSPVAADEEPVTQADDAAVSDQSTDSEAAVSPSGATAASAPDRPARGGGAVPEAPAPAQSRAASSGDHRSNRLIAELTNAMRVAAEAARETTLSQYRAEGKAFVERVQAEASERVGDYKRQADADIASIRDWSKAEAARIREETERKIADRKSRLGTELDEHAARIEREVRRVEARIAGFEEDMSRFFEELLGEEDPSRFGALAASLPEPPTFESVLAEAEAAEDAEATAEIAAGERVETTGEAEATVDGGEVVAIATDAASDTDEPEQSAIASEGSTGEPGATEVSATEASETEAMTAPETEEPAAGAVESEAEADSALPADDGMAAVASAEGDPTEVEATQPTEPIAADVAPADADTTGAEPVAAEVGSFASTHDPRLAALGLTPDYAAAEAEAFVDATTDQDDDGSSDSGIPMIAEDALASRLNNLMPSRDDQGAWPASHAAPTTRTTQVVVVGLVSVASIASFKRHLARVEGVNSVGVSSGPDGEFVFAVSHVDTIDLREVVPALPGFKARVSSAGEGIVNVTAHDPESDS